MGATLDVNSIPRLDVGLSNQRRREAYSPLSCHSTGKLSMGENVFVEKGR